jgi:hypothetical protein
LPSGSDPSINPGKLPAPAFETLPTGSSVTNHRCCAEPVIGDTGQVVPRGNSVALSQRQTSTDGAGGYPNHSQASSPR